MYTIEIEDIENNKGNFEELHKQPVVTSSEIATVCGLGWSTPLELWAIKTGRKVLDLSAQADTLWMGQKLEPVIAELFERKTNQKLKRVNQVWRSVQYPFALCSPDYMFEDAKGDKIIVEIKSTRYYNKEAWGPDKAPDHAHCQLMWQMGISGFNAYGFCAGLLGGDPTQFYYPIFKYDQPIFEMMLQKAQRFVELIKCDTPPELVPADKKSIVSLFGKPQEHETKELGQDAVSLIKQVEELSIELSKANEQAVKLKEKIEDLKIKIWGKTDNSAVSLAGDYVVLCREITRKSYTVPDRSWFEVKIKKGNAKLEE